MAIEYQVFSDVGNVSLGVTDIHGVRSISLAKRRSELRAAGDEEIYESIVRPATCSLSGTIELSDVAQAEALNAAVGTLSFTWHDGRGQADKTVAVTGVYVASVDIAAGHQSPSRASVSFIVECPDGITDPVAV